MEVSSVNLAENFLNVAIPFGNGTALASSADEEDEYYDDYYYNDEDDEDYYYDDDYYEDDEDDDDEYVAPVNYQTNNGITVGLFGYENSYIDLSTGVYGTAQHIDATNSYSAFNVLIGNAAPNCIMAGHGSTNLWGGIDFANDVLIGGASQDLFLYGKTEGSDSILNASANDAVYLYDVSLSDIVAAGADGAGTVAIIFNTGNGIAVSGSDLVSATFILRDGSKYAYNKVTHSWQTA